MTPGGLSASSSLISPVNRLSAATLSSSSQRARRRRQSRRSEWRWTVQLGGSIHGQLQYCRSRNVRARSVRIRWAGRPVQSGMELVGQAGTTAVTFTGGSDDGSAALSLGTNSFNFFGTQYTGNASLFVSTNGLITFGSGNTAYQNDDMTSLTQPAIAVLWDDWIIGSGSPQALLQTLCQQRRRQPRSARNRMESGLPFLELAERRHVPSDPVFEYRRNARWDLLELSGPQFRRLEFQRR